MKVLKELEDQQQEISEDIKLSAPDGPVVPLHVAEIVEDAMKERGWTFTGLIDEMGPFESSKAWRGHYLGWKLFFDVREPELQLEPAMATQLGSVFDVPGQLFVDLHEQWRSFAKRAAAA